MTLDGRIVCCEEGIDHSIQVARRTLESRGVLDSVAFRAVACTASIGRAVGMLDSWQRQLMDLLIAPYLQRSHLARRIDMIVVCIPETNRSEQTRD